MQHGGIPPISEHLPHIALEVPGLILRRARGEKIASPSLTPGKLESVPGEWASGVAD